MFFIYKGFTICFERQEYNGILNLQTRENADYVEILVEIFHTNRTFERSSTNLEHNIKIDSKKKKVY
jgi:hypothetical protein